MTARYGVVSPTVPCFQRCVGLPGDTRKAPSVDVMRAMMRSLPFSGMFDGKDQEAIAGGV